MIIVTAIECPFCKDTVYSRARHDMRRCSCGKVAIDGGFDYTRLVYDPSLATVPTKSIQLDTDKKALYDDWNKGKAKYGLIKGK
jgi:ribosomal protein L37AE/L43A